MDRYTRIVLTEARPQDRPPQTGPQADEWWMMLRHAYVRDGELTVAERAVARAVWTLCRFAPEVLR